MTLASPWSVGRQVAARSADGGIWPPPGGSWGNAVSGMPGPYVYDAASARRIPAVARCLQVYSGLCKQMHMDAWRGPDMLPRPRLLDRPDPTRARSWYVHVSVEDYLLEGNAISLITSRGVDGWPLSVQWLPASWVYIVWTWGMPRPDYYMLGQQLNFDDVIHVRRGADRFLPVRGVGVVEEFLGTLDRVASEEAYERQTLAGAAVPSVAIITPQATLTQDVADQAKSDWMDKFAGAQRLPAVLPNGTQIIPLAWSPTDSQMVEARHMSLTDVANAFNIDSYWVGAPVSGMTYRTAAPQYQQVLLTSLEPVLADFEQVWSDAWLPRGTQVQFGRDKLLREDLPTTATALSALVAANIASAEECRSYLMGNPLDLSGPAPRPPKPPPASPVSPAPAADNQPADQGVPAK